MTGNPVHDLFDSFSSGGPGSSSVSVDDLVRMGRRRQRGVAFAATGATAGVVTIAVGAAFVATPGSSRSPVADGLGSAAASSSPAPAATRLVPLNGPVGAAIPITAVSVLAGGKKLEFFAETVACAGPARGRVVSQTDTRVVLALALGKTVPPPVEPSWPAASQAPLPGCDPRPTTLTEVPGAAHTVSAGDIVTLSEPLGSRQLIDESSGKPIAVTTAAQFAAPQWTPSGFRPVGDVQPNSPHVWEEFWDGQDQGSLTLAETYDTAAAIQDANTSVNGHPARFRSTPNASALDWVADGRLFSLSATHTDECQAAASQAAATSCVPVTPVGQPLSQNTLLRVAGSIAAA